MRSLLRILVCLWIAGGSSLCRADFPAWSTLGVPNAASSVAGGMQPAVLLATRIGANPVRSSDAGATWTEFDVLGARPLYFLAAPNDPLVFYAVAGSDGLAVTPPPRALYRSSDGGRTWQLISARIETDNGADVENLAVGAAPGLLYASRMAPYICFTGSCTFSGIEGYVSTDSGRTWKLSDPLPGPLPPGTGNHNAYPSASNPNVVYEMTRPGLYRSDDQGATWRLVLGANGDLFFDERPVVVDRANPDIVYVRRDKGTALSVTEDGGMSWRTAEPVDVPGPFRELLADPMSAGIVYFVGSEGEVFRSTDRARTWHRVAPSSGGFVLGSRALPVIAVQGAARDFYAVGSAGVKRVEIDGASLALRSDLWWNPAESGWGLTLTQHASGELFGVWFTYDAQGSPIWRVMPGGTWTDGNTFVATVYETRGPAYSSAVFDPAKVGATAMGQATLQFADDNSATFTYRLNDGTVGESPIRRQLFGPANDAQVVNMADLWWNAGESGWGVAVNHQFRNVFAVWFVYDATGRPVWFAMPNAVYATTADGNSFPTYAGELYATRGPPLGSPYDPAKVVVVPVGSASITFSARDSALSKLDALGQTALRTISRQPF